MESGPPTLLNDRDCLDCLLPPLKADVLCSSPSQEGVTDFRALRAKFQNDSTLANKLVQPHKKPPAAIPPKLGSGGNAVSSPLPLSKRERIKIKPKGEPAHPASQASALTQRNPVARPRARLGYLEMPGQNAERKGNVSEKGLSSPKSGREKPLPSHFTDRRGSAQTAPEDSLLSSSFHHALQILENTLSRGKKASATLATPRAANFYVRPCPEQMCAPAASGSSGMQPSGSDAVVDSPAQKKDALRRSEPAPSQLGYRAPREPPQHQKGTASYTLNVGI